MVSDPPPSMYAVRVRECVSVSVNEYDENESASCVCELRNV
ncbi:MAG: hypothetical protein N2V77_01340 [Canidatus Methanoxibalbensis ujae]|nr:hypothetical protein [Candidatus Methanoxibalbensis ujae]